ncbi:hypothetical protein D3C87_2030840 [compost metagenome]
MADESTGIDINGRHGLGLIDNQIPTRFQFNFSVKGTLDLIFHIKQVENRLLSGVQLQLRGHLWNIFTGELHQMLKGLT